MWTMGIYVAKALESTIGDELIGMFGNNKTDKHPYPDKPFMSDDNSENVSETLAERELRRFTATQAAFRANWRRSHGGKPSEE